MVGAGAAGLVAAIFAAAGPVPVVVLERTADGGRKILISGGGRCNILPSALTPARFVTDSPAHLLRGLLRSWPLAAQRRFFEDEVGVPLALEPETGKLFPRSNRARDVRDGLVALARRRGVQFQFGVDVRAIVRDGQRWRLDTSAGPIHGARVILATGGLSVPATGSDGTGLRIAAALGHAVHDTYPALTPLTFSPSHDHESAARLGVPGAAAFLSGLSLPVRLRAKWRNHTIESHGGFLFTHRGYSGPAVLDISHVCVRSLMDGCGQVRTGADGCGQVRATVRVCWTHIPAAEWESRLRGGHGSVAGVLSRELPERLSQFLLDQAGVPRDRRVSSLTRKERVTLITCLTSFELPWTGHEGYKKAEVTGGGIALDEVDPRTLESQHHPGLFLCGEMLDAFGPIGGHNFAWAWATGRAAGLAAAARIG
ncbi:MAG: NAD(P)/FAD-dependent oxidoreductase [Vicinamibacterales bacterium]